MGRRRGDTVETDLLIIGSGFAGLWAAVSTREAGAKRIAIVDKGAIGLTSQSKMAAGATIYCLPKHDRDAWLKEMAEVQGMLCRQDMVAEMLDTSYERLRQLERWGVSYLRSPFGCHTLPSRGFHQVEMLVLPERKAARGGAAVVGALLEQVQDAGDGGEKTALFPRTMVTSLLLEDGRAVGAVGVDRRSGAVTTFSARAVVLAAADCSFRGGYACVDAVTGDGFALAYDAGARLSNMEFLTTNTGSPYYGFEGTGVAARHAHFLDRELRPFMAAYHPDADAAEVCHLVQAMASETTKGNGPPFYFDMTGWRNRRVTAGALRRVGNMVSLNLERLQEAGVPLFSKPQEWMPLAQALHGGVRTDIDCMSDVLGLFAAGTCQAVDPGLFNGWSTMRAMWSGEKAGRSAAAYLEGGAGGRRSPDRGDELRLAAVAPLEGEGPSPDAVCLRLQRLLFPAEVSILKNRARLELALYEVTGLLSEEIPVLRAADPHELVKAHETANMAKVAELFLRASLEREESRGDHARTDHPLTDNARWLKWVNLSKGPDGEPLVETEPVPLAEYPVQP